MWSGAPGPASAADAQGGTTPVPPPLCIWVLLVSTICTAGLEHVFWQKTQFLRGFYLSFRKSETNDFCFAKSSDQQVGVFRCGTSWEWCVCQEHSGQVLLPLPVAAWSGHGQGHRRGIGAPQGKPCPEGAWQGSWLGALPLAALPGVSLNPWLLSLL